MKIEIFLHCTATISMFAAGFAPIHEKVKAFRVNKMYPYLVAYLCEIYDNIGWYTYG